MPEAVFCGEMIPADDLMRLLNRVLERMDYSRLHAARSRLGRIGRSPESLFKILVHGYMTGIYSCWEQERACRRDVNFMCPLGIDIESFHVYPFSE